MAAGRLQSRLLIVGAVVFVAFVVGGVLLVRDKPESNEPSCGPATQAEAQAAIHELARRYGAGAEPTDADPPSFQGAGIGQADDGSLVVTAMLLPGTDSHGYPRCVDDVPVEWMFGGPFQTD